MVDKDLEHKSIKDVFDKHEFVSTEISDILNNRPLPKHTTSSNDFSQSFSHKNFSLEETQSVNKAPQAFTNPYDLNISQPQKENNQKQTIEFDFSSYNTNVNVTPSHTTTYQQEKKASYNFESEEPVGPKWKKQAKPIEPVTTNFISESPKPVELVSQGGLDFDFSVQNKLGSEPSLPKNKVLKLGGSKKIGDESKSTSITADASNKLDAYFGSQQQTKPPVNFDEDFI